MKTSATRFRTVLCLAGSLCLAATRLSAEPPTQPLFPLEELSAACAAAKGGFRPPTQADLEPLETELFDAAARLDQRLTADGDNGANWKTYLQFDRMQSQLRRDEGPDPDVLYETYHKFRAQHEGLRLIWFADVREALRRHRLTRRAIGRPEEKTAYENIVNGLPGYLEAYAAEPTTKLALEIGNALRWLQDRRQAPELVEKLRHELCKPNLSIRASAEMLAAAIERPVDRTEPVRDLILGTTIRGTGRTTGQLSVKLVPDPKHAVFDAIFHGTTKSRTVGYNGPVRIYSNGVTSFGARKRMWLSAEGLAALPTDSKAKTRNRIDRICSNRGRQIVEKIAWRRARSQQQTAERIASRHAEGRFNERLDQEVAGTIDRTNTSFDKKIRQPLLQRKLFPQRLDFSTTQEAIHIVGLTAEPSQLGAPGKPPELPPECDLAVRLHESMINNMAITALAGTLIREETVLDALRRMEASPEVLDRARSMEGEPPWKIAFERLRLGGSEAAVPISVKFADNRFVVTVRGSGYYRGSQSLPAMNMRAEYKFEQTERGFKAKRQGPLQVTRPDGAFAGPNGVVLRRRFEGLFKNEILIEEIDMKVSSDRADGGVADGGAVEKRTIRMRPVQCICENGWLALAWRRVPADPPDADDP